MTEEAVTGGPAAVPREPVTAGTPAHPLAGYSTATVSDALDRLGREGCLPGIAPLSDGARIFGRAYTVSYVAAGRPAGTVGDYLDDMAPGDVAVLDNGGRTDCTVWGDILTAMAHDRGIAGTVIDGVCRDVWRALDVGYPLFTRGRYMRTGKDRVEVRAVGCPVGVAGIQVVPGQLIIADGDGAVTVPPDVEDELADICHSIHERESRIVEDVLAGRTLAESRAAHGYHLLQRNQA
ncbi:RraA family protein [Streptomyces sp. NBC_01498]|uniref:RraA family protein n=1 Tax=Streptomyces sp. NBC_01498 TaxID=2975870 RepID=UPI002E7AF370|nr:RraA family protein [Streptomyces sp. NBC_01498]WTL27984.1 RraA family protein [Streptomyces sp. NBC_01498]